MMKIPVKIIFTLLAVSGLLFADGLMRPSAAAYPGNFLRHRMTKIDVDINGQIARTTVYQEFVNEWSSATDAVYSFPLPHGARATALYFWSNDTMYRAVLKVKEQSPNPGTGEGGIDAEVNAYLGPNGIRMLIPGIPAGEVQRVQMEYISLCDFGNGNTEYRYPLNTTDFVLTPVETFLFTVNVRSQQPITSTSLQPSAGASVTQPDPHHLKVSLSQSKVYFTHDLRFSYTATHDSLSSEFFAAEHDTTDGHFVVLLKSPSGGAAGDVFGKNVVFVIDRNSDLFGATLNEAKTGIAECIRRLNQGDAFNIVVIDYTNNTWRASLSAATDAAKDSAIAFISGITYSYSYLGLSSFQTAFNQFPGDTTNNLVVLFSEGKIPVMPEQVRAINTKNVSVMTVTSASAAGRQRMELIAYGNYGLPAVIERYDLLSEKIVQVFDRFNMPVMRNVHFETSPNVFDMIPTAPPSLYKGSLVFFTGRFKDPLASVLSLAGYSTAGSVFRNIPLDFPSQAAEHSFVRSFWAKEKIDDIERRIAVYGENDSLKNLDIAISLGYGIRCKYTSYNAEKTHPVLPPAASVEETIEFLSSSCRIDGDIRLLRWDVSQNASVAEFKIYRRNSPSDPFLLIATVDGREMSFRDETPAPAGVMYRIDAVSHTGRIRSHYLSPASGPLRSLVLHGNFPNPFNPSTNISFDNPVHQQLTLSVHDLAGREVARLVDGPVEPGSYSVSFHGKNLASGLYLCRLKGETSFRTAKMLLVK